MAVLGNRSTENGDILHIKTDFPLIGLLTLQSFIVNTEGESEDKKFIKEYRVSVDGSNYSPWKELSLSNLQSESVKSTDTVFLEYKMTRSGGDITGEIAFNSVQLVGTFAEPIKQPNYDNSVFADFFDSLDIKVLNWAINVLEKLYQKGLVPDEIERTDDFVELYRPVCEFFSYHVQLARTLKDFYQNGTLLTNFLENRDLNFSGNESISVLQEYARNIYREIGKRGTVEIFSKSIDEVFGDNRFGEFLRLIAYGQDSEFVFAFAEPIQSGWYIDRSSPMYRSNNYNGYNKLYENGFHNKEKWGVEESEASISFVDGAMEISSVTSGETKAIDPVGDSFLIPINKNQVYEFSFNVSQSTLSPIIVAGVRLFDENRNEISPKKAIDLSVTNYFLNGAKLGAAGKTNLVTCILYPVDSDSKIYKTSLSSGDNLLSSGARYMKPILGVSNQTGSASSTVRFWDFRITPISLSGKSFMNLKNQIEIFCENKNDALSNEDVDRITRNDLIPANSALKINYLN